VVLIILDGVGCGALPDAQLFGDADANTLGNLAEVIGGLDLPNLERMGLGNIIEIKGMETVASPIASYGKMAELSFAKDSTVGHWELMGLVNIKPFPTYPKGFPPEIVERLRRESGKEFIGNIPASGTEIIAQLGEEHLRTGALILYTSADSVLQIAGHEDIVPPAELYRICRIARRIMSGEHAVGRIIARPFIGEPGAFVRTAHRHDFSLQPSEDTVLDFLKAKKVPTIGIGKIFDLYGGKGLDISLPTASNTQGMDKIIELSRETEFGLVFANLVDFDTLWGHRNDARGFYQGLLEFDHWLPEIWGTLRSDDMLILTADHGVDPTTVSTDHSREYVPLLVMIPRLKAGVNLGLRRTFADVGATICEYFNIRGTGQGKSFLNLMN
jgi:phosphopentomutase